MSAIVEITAAGILHLPPEILQSIPPHTRFVVEWHNGTLILRPEPTSEPEPSDNSRQPLWATATPQEQAEDFLRWALSHKDGPGLPDEALRRENMYD
jgi:hypothetical protein